MIGVDRDSTACTWSCRVAADLGTIYDLQAIRGYSDIART